MWGGVGDAMGSEVGGSERPEQKPRASQRVVKIERVGGGGDSLENLPCGWRAILESVRKRCSSDLGRAQSGGGMDRGRDVLRRDRGVEE